MVKAAVYKKYTPSKLYSDYVYEKIPHFEKRLRELQRPYLAKKHSSAPRVEPARTTASKPAESNLEQQTTPQSLTPEPVTSKPEKENYYLPKFDGNALIFPNQIQFYLHSSPTTTIANPNIRKLEPEKFSLINRLTINSGWVGIESKLRDWPNLLHEAEKQEANIIARGKRRPHSSFYYLFKLSDEDALKDVVEYTVSNFKEKNITPVLER